MQVEAEARWRDEDTAELRSKLDYAKEEIKAAKGSAASAEEETKAIAAQLEEVADAALLLHERAGASKGDAETAAAREAASLAMVKRLKSRCVQLQAEAVELAKGKSSLAREASAMRAQLDRLSADHVESLQSREQKINAMSEKADSAVRKWRVAQGERDGAIEAIATAVGRQTLVLKGVGMRDDECASLMGTIVSGLATINLSDNKLSDASAPLLARYLASSPSTTHIDVSGNAFSAYGVRVLANGAAKAFPTCNVFVRDGGRLDVVDSKGILGNAVDDGTISQSATTTTESAAALSDTSSSGVSTHSRGDVRCTIIVTQNPHDDASSPHMLRVGTLVAGANTLHKSYSPGRIRRKSLIATDRGRKASTMGFKSRKIAKRNSAIAKAYGGTM